MRNPFKKNPTQAVSSSPEREEKRIFRSEDLFGSSREVVILHGEAQYRLQITRAGKLILNK